MICIECGEYFKRQNNKGSIIGEDICNKCAKEIREERANQDIFYNNFQNKEYA